MAHTLVTAGQIVAYDSFAKRLSARSTVDLEGVDLRKRAQEIAPGDLVASLCEPRYHLPVVIVFVLSVKVTNNIPKTLQITGLMFTYNCRSKAFSNTRRCNCTDPDKSWKIIPCGPPAKSSEIKFLGVQELSMPVSLVTSMIFHLEGARVA